MREGVREPRRTRTGFQSASWILRSELTSPRSILVVPYILWAAFCHADHSRRSAALCRRPQPLSADDAETRPRENGLRSGRSDPRAGARSGPDAAPSRPGLPAGDLERRYSELGRRGGLLLELRVRDEIPAGADASAIGDRRSRRRARGPGRPRAGRRRSSCWSSCASAVPCTRARSTTISRTGRSRTTGAVRRTPRPICWTPCTTAAGCAWRGARAAFASTPPTSTGPGRPTRPPGASGSTRSSTWPSASTRRCPVRACRSSCDGCALPCRSGTARSKGALQRAKERLAHARVDGIDWYWPAGEDPAARFSAGHRALADALRSGRVTTATASSSCGAGSTVSKPTRRRPNASSAITRCRCSGATA